jgi:hypothetical protein
MWLSMSRLLLDGYKPVNKRWPVYTLDTATKEIETQWFSSQTEGKKAGPTCGRGDFRKAGRWGSRHEAFFALYAYDGALHLWLDGQDVNFDHHNVQVKRGADFLLRKHFQVIVDGQRIFECRYSYIDHEDVPDEDIFWSMARNLANPERRLRNLLLLQDKANGISSITDSYLQALDDRVKRGLASTK